MKYNGYTNYETWSVLLWASNEEHLYRQTEKFVYWSAHLAAFDHKCQTFFRDMFPNGTPDMDSADDMKLVDWKEIARHLTEWND
jgi:hypothetical protein